MLKFLAYLRNDKGGAVEYVLVVAGIGAAVATATTNSAIKASINAMFADMFNDAKTASGGVVK